MLRPARPRAPKTRAPSIRELAYAVANELRPRITSGLFHARLRNIDFKIGTDHRGVYRLNDALNVALNLGPLLTAKNEHSNLSPFEILLIA